MAGDATPISRFASRLRSAQSEIGVTNEELAREMGVGLRLVQRWRSGESEPTGANLVRLASALNRDSAWFYAEPDSKAAA